MGRLSSPGKSSMSPVAMLKQAPCHGHRTCPLDKTPASGRSKHPALLNTITTVYFRRVDTLCKVKALSASLLSKQTLTLNQWRPIVWAFVPHGREFPMFLNEQSSAWPQIHFSHPARTIVQTIREILQHFSSSPCPLRLSDYHEQRILTQF